jgi:hypothetical protein
MVKVVVILMILEMTMMMTMIDDSENDDEIFRFGTAPRQFIYLSIFID